MKHSNKIVVCQVVIMSTVKEVSRGAQTSGLVRKTTVKTGQNQARCLGHRPIWQRSGGYLHSFHCLFIPGGGVPDSFPAPTKCASNRGRSEEPSMAVSIAHWDSPTFLLDPTNSPRCSSDTHAPRREMADNTRAASREATHWESIPPGIRLTRSFRSQTSRWWMILPCSLNDRRVNTCSCKWSGLGRVTPMPGTVKVGNDGCCGPPPTLEKDTCNERLAELRCASDVRAYGWAAFMWPKERSA